jgi:hypothetical protein
MRVLLWVTTLQADSLALALHLDESSDESMVVCVAPDAWRREPIAAVRPLRAAPLARTDRATLSRATAFEPDVVVFDNHLPPKGLAPRVCSMWHGLGWKARPESDLRQFHAGIERLTGVDPRRPNPRFLAQCYGEPDRDWRAAQWGLHPDGCRVVGMPFSDLLRSPPYSRATLQPWYPELDLQRRKTVLLSFTWHYGRIFPGSWRGSRCWDRDPGRADAAFLRALVHAVIDDGGQVLLCLHDRHRYEPSYLATLRDALAGLAHVHVKHKDERPDNLADLVIADVMVTNLSSFVTYFYVSGRPSVHILPTTAADVRSAQIRRGRVRERRDGTSASWMTDPHDNGGLSATDADQTIAAVRRALREPDCCRERSAAWLAARVHGMDGMTCARMADALRELADRKVG